MAGSVTIETALWGQLDGNEPVHRFILTDPGGVQVEVSDLGASLIAWRAPDRAGRHEDIVLGLATPADYAKSGTHMGGSIGRYANRIAGARFVLDGRDYRLQPNDGANLLHGGERGFDRAVWHASVHERGVRFAHVSPDGDNGFPGRLEVEVDYRLEGGDTVTIDYTARTTAPTPLNLTCHPYFNLRGSGTALDHVVEIHAERVLLTDAAGIPTEEVGVGGTALDFRHPARLRDRVASSEAAITAVQGIDHCFVLRDAAIAYGPLVEVARARDPASGREVTVSTTERGLQLYTAVNLEGVVDRDGVTRRAYDAFCFEAQAQPNQINGTERLAAAVVLRPGETYRQTTSFRVGIGSAG